MNKAPVPPSPRAQRLQLILAGLVWSAALLYCIYGAMAGELALPGRDGVAAVVRGWAAWLACLMPVIGMAMSVYLHPSSRLTGRQRLTLGIALLVAMAVVLLVAIRHGPQNWASSGSRP